MSVPNVPSLRQPKFVTNPQKNASKKKFSLPDIQYVIVTLKDGHKLVVSSDAYHGIITVGEMYKCVFCHVEMKLNSSRKEEHKNSKGHLKLLEKFPPAEEYAENLVRKLTKDSAFCTICNVAVSNVNLPRHLLTEVHTEELQKAKIRALTYKAY